MAAPKSAPVQPSESFLPAPRRFSLAPFFWWSAEGDNLEIRTSPLFHSETWASKTIKFENHVKNKQTKKQAKQQDSKKKKHSMKNCSSFLPRDFFYYLLWDKGLSLCVCVRASALPQHHHLTTSGLIQAVFFSWNLSNRMLNFQHNILFFLLVIFSSVFWKKKDKENEHMLFSCFSLIYTFSQNCPI